MRILALLVFLVTTSIAVADDWDDEDSNGVDEAIIARQQEVIEDLEDRVDDLEWDSQRYRRERQEKKEREWWRELDEMSPKSERGSRGRDSYPEWWDNY